MYVGQASGTVSLWEFDCVEPDDPTEDLYKTSTTEDKTNSGAINLTATAAVMALSLTVTASLIGFLL